MSTKKPGCKICNLCIENQQHLLIFTGCEKINSLKKEYQLKLKSILENAITTGETKQLILQNLSNWMTGGLTVEARTIALDASSTLIRVCKQQQTLGWEQWFKGRLLLEWSYLRNHEIHHKNTGLQHATSEKWAIDTILIWLTFVYEIWKMRNKHEHDDMGDPIWRWKQKLIEIILGEAKKNKQTTYKGKDLEIDTLLKCTEDNLQMIQLKIINGL
jgi:hypothetical protein